MYFPSTIYISPSPCCIPSIGGMRLSPYRWVTTRSTCKKHLEVDDDASFVTWPLDVFDCVVIVPCWSIVSLASQFQSHPRNYIFVGSITLSVPCGGCFDNHTTDYLEKWQRSLDNNNNYMHTQITALSVTYLQVQHNRYSA